MATWTDQLENTGGATTFFFKIDDNFLFLIDDTYKLIIQDASDITWTDQIES